MSLPKGISQRPDGLYTARIMYHGIKKEIYGRDLNKLIEEFEELKYKLKHQQFEEDTKLTVKQFSEIYIDKKRFDEVKENTINSYNQALKNHILPKFEKYRMADVTKEQLREFITDVAEYADGTKGIVWTVIKGMFDLAYSDGYLKRNAADGIICPKQRKTNRATRMVTKSKAFTSTEYTIVLQEAEKLETSDLIHFTAYTGLRLGEVLAVKYTDIDFDKSILAVQRSIDPKGNIDTPKTEAGTRIVPLSAEAMRIVKKQKFISGNGYIFCDKSGNPYTVNFLQSEMRKLNKLCRNIDENFKHFSLHTFRHTFATKCANKGMIPKVLMGIMGHSTISMTMDYYSHQEMESAIEELKKVEGAF